MTFSLIVENDHVDRLFLQFFVVNLSALKLSVTGILWLNCACGARSGQKVKKGNEKCLEAGSNC